MKLIDTLINKAFSKATVASKEAITSKTWRLMIKVSPADFKDYVPGQQIRIVTGLDNPMALSDFLRTYSVWHYDELSNIAEIAVCTFSGGPGEEWITSINPGDTVYFNGPKGRFIIDTTAVNYQFFGDISALAHLYELARHVGRNKSKSGIIYGDSKEHYFADTADRKPFGFLLKDNELLDNMTAEIAWNNIPRENTLVYIAGEAGFCQGLNHYFRKELGWPSQQIKTKPFWHPGKKGLE